MPLNPKPLILFYFIAIGWLCAVSCKRSDNQLHIEMGQYVQTADSMVLNGKIDSAINFLKQKRSLFKEGDAQLAAYYEFLSLQYHASDTAATTRYADSALMVFARPENIDKYPDVYFKALLAKGDACIIAKQYETALAFYDKAKKLLSEGNCDDGNLAAKIGGIYFNQKNYKMAASYWVDSYNRLLKCASTMTAQKLFFLKQAALNNTGVSYERAGRFDSAYYFYKIDLDYINQTEQLGVIKKSAVAGPRIVVYDNIGGLYLKQGKLKDALQYLTASISIPNKDINGLRITPFLKLAELYLKIGDLDKAEGAFKYSRYLLDMYGKDNAIPDVDWNRLFAQYLFARQKPVQAYQYQTKYIRLKDSLEKANTSLHRLDINRELYAIQRETLLNEMAHNEAIERLYIIGATVVAILLMGIIISINRVLIQSRAKHSAARLHNEQLQQTLEELERANKNVVRVMRVMAHDLRNPLAGMIGLANSAADAEIPDETKHMLKLLEDTGNHSLNMINELLNSGLADENEALAKQQLDVKELLRDSVELLQFKASEKKQQITFESGDYPIITHINHEKIWRVFNNLIVNAIKFSYEGGMIYVSIKAVSDNKILISIADNGMGIPEKDKESVFEMFTPAKRVGTDGEQPFGLGLSISKRIIENHNGRLWFESSPGFGTTFYIELPLI